MGLLWPLAAVAQFQGQVGGGGGGGSPFGTSGQYGPNAYNRNTQPLSPYLNLLRNGNPAVNYFYGVRQGTNAGGFGSPLQGNFGQLGRQTFFPQVENLYDLENVNPGDGLRPTGHMVGFTNTLNYFGAGSSGNQRQQRAALAPPKTGGK